MKRLLSLAGLVAVIASGCQPAAADTGKWLVQNLRTRSTLAVVETDVKSWTPFRRVPQLTIRCEGIGGTDLGNQRGLAGYLVGAHAQLPFGFDLFVGGGHYCEALAKPTQALVFCIGKGF